MEDDEKYRVTFKTMKETTHSNQTGVVVKREDVGGNYILQMCEIMMPLIYFN